MSIYSFNAYSHPERVGTFELSVSYHSGAGASDNIINICVITLRNWATLKEQKDKEIISFVL